MLLNFPGQLVGLPSLVARLLNTFARSYSLSNLLRTGYMFTRIDEFLLS